MGFEKPMKFFCDNKSTISIARNPVHRDRTKHVEVDRHFIKDKLKADIIDIEYVTTSHQLVDLPLRG